MEECKKHKLNQKAGNFCNQIRTIRILIRNIWTPPPGLSGPMSGVSGYIIRPEVLHNPIRNIRTTIRNLRTQHPDYPDLCPEYPDTPVVFHFVPTSKMHEFLKQ